MLQFLREEKGYDVANLNVTDIFTSEYDLYHMNIVAYVNSDNSGYLFGRLIDSSGSVISASEYDMALKNMRSYTTSTQNNFTSTDAFQLGYSQSDSTNSTGSITKIFNPADSSKFTFGLTESSTFVSGFGGAGLKGFFVHRVAETISGIQFLPATADSTGISYIRALFYGVK